MRKATGSIPVVPTKEKARTESQALGSHYDSLFPVKMAPIWGPKRMRMAMMMIATRKMTTPYDTSP